MLKFRRIRPGHYLAHWRQRDVVISRVQSIGLRTNESVWSIIIDGQSLVLCHETLREAKDYANRYVDREGD